MSDPKVLVSPADGAPPVPAGDRSEPKVQPSPADGVAAASRREKWLGVGSLVLFGGVVGVVAVLSEKSGTGVTLLGLLFALMGGSLVSLFANPSLTERLRCQLGIAVGLISVGIALGMALAFTLKADRVATTTDQSRPPSPFVIHSSQQDQVRQLARACKTVLANIPENDPTANNSSICRSSWSTCSPARRSWIAWKAS